MNKQPPPTLSNAANVGLGLFERLAGSFPDDENHAQSCYAALAMLVFLVVTNGQRGRADEGVKNLFELNARVAEILRHKKNDEAKPSKRVLN